MLQFITSIYIAPLQVGLLRGAPNPKCWWYDTQRAAWNQNRIGWFSTNPI